MFGQPYIQFILNLGFINQKKKQLVSDRFLPQFIIFSYSVQHAPALGRAVMEGMFDHQFTTLDLSRFLVDRIINGEKIIDRRNTLIDGS